MPTPTEDLLRTLAPQVLGTLTRRFGQFDACEDAVQEALLAAAQQWPAEGTPQDPRAWLTTVARRRLVDGIRSETARRRRELETVTLGARVHPATTVADDTLTLLYLCCHPSLSRPSQLALTLRAVGGLTTVEIARAFLVPESTMAQRISRAKQSLRSSGLAFALPPEPERGERLGVVLQVLYLLFNEGYTSSGGPDLQRPDLTGEAIRLARLLLEAVPAEREVAGLLALMLLTDARRTARTDDDGLPVPLDRQDRSVWDRAQIDEGIALLTRTLGTGPVGPYQLQAAIAAVHDEAAHADDTDWAQILALYGVLERIAPGPVVTLNRAVAVAMVHGPRAGLALLGTLDHEPRMAHHHRREAVRAHLLERAGDLDAAREAYRRAARLTESVPEQRYLALRSAALEGRASSRGRVSSPRTVRHLDGVSTRTGPLGHDLGMLTVVSSTDLPASGRTARFEGEEHGSGVSFFLVDTPPGSGPVLHKHPYTETWVVRAGSVRITADGVDTVAGPGDIAVVPPDTPHKFVNIGDGDLEMICIHASPRILQENLE